MPSVWAMGWMWRGSLQCRRREKWLRFAEEEKGRSRAGLEVNEGKMLSGQWAAGQAGGSRRHPGPEMPLWACRHTVRVPPLEVDRLCLRRVCLRRHSSERSLVRRHWRTDLRFVVHSGFCVSSCTVSCGFVFTSASVTESFPIRAELK